MKQEIIEGVVARLALDLSVLQAGPGSTSPSTALKPFYTAKELAARWNFKKPDSIYEIPEIELPRRRVGAGRGKTLFYWLDILVYEGTLTTEMAYALQEKRLALLEGSPQVPRRLRRLGDTLDARQD